jgi:uncharacterized protein
MIACESQCRPELADRTVWRRRMSFWSGEGAIHHDRHLALAGTCGRCLEPGLRQPDLALDGYLTGVIIAPRPIPTAYWQGAVLAGDDLLLHDEGHARATRETLVSRHAALVGDIDEHLARLERDCLCDYRPTFWPDEGAPSHSVIRRWAGGFSVAMALAPGAWSRLIEDERTQDLVVPFIGFFERDDPEFEPADDIAERLDQAAAAIPRAILVLRKLAKRRAADGFATQEWSVSRKTGRNEPCPCGSGRKRCCGQAASGTEPGLQRSYQAKGSQRMS